MAGDETTKENEETSTPTSQERGTLRGKVSKAGKLLRRRISEKDRNKVEKQIETLKVDFDKFENYHDKYHATLIDETVIKQSDEYFDEVEQIYMSALDDANKFLDCVTSIVQLNVHEKTLEALDNQSNLAHLTLSVFDGSDPLEYLPWITVFDETVDSKNISKPVKLARMLQYTGGMCRRQIRHCPLDKENGYDNARKILADTYGNPHFLLQKTMDNLKSGPPVVNGQDLVQLGNDLAMAISTISGLNLLSEIDNQLVIRDILKRCPRYLQTKYSNYCTDFKFEKSKYPCFKEFVTFIQKWAVKKSDPIWSQEDCSSNYELGSVNSLTGFTPDRKTMLECLMCGEHHLLYHCPHFKSLGLPDRLRFIEEKKLCSLCFSNAHAVEHCRSQYRCTALNLDDSICNARHSRVIHHVTTGNQDFDVNHTMNNNENTGSASLTIRHSANVYLPTVPVVLPNADVTCTFLDQCSTNSFISESLANKLNLKIKHIDFKTATLSGLAVYDRTVSCELRSLDGRTVIVDMLVTDQLPARHPNVKTSSFISSHAHLSDLPLDHVDYDNEIHMLIGNDQANLTQPYETRCDQNGKNVPFATRSYFGWSLSGPVPMQTYTPVSEMSSTCLDKEMCVTNSYKMKRQHHNVNTISVLQHKRQASVRRPQVKPVCNLEKHSRFIPRKHDKPENKRNALIVKQTNPDRYNYRLPYSHSMQSNKYQMYRRTIDTASSHDQSPCYHTANTNNHRFDCILHDSRFSSNDQWWRPF